MPTPIELHPPKESYAGIGAFIKRFFILSDHNIVPLLAMSIGTAALLVAGSQAFTGALSSQSGAVFIYLYGTLIWRVEGGETKLDSFSIQRVIASSDEEVVAPATDVSSSRTQANAI